jgi:hypothetical protein
MFGFLKGNIVLNLNKYNISPGDVVSGTLTLNLKKSLKAKELVIRLIAYEVRRRLTTKGGSSSSTKIYDVKIPLDGEKEYLPSSQPLVYNFSITIPKSVGSINEVANNSFGSAIKTVQLFSGVNNTVTWYLEGRLSIPWFDIKKRIQLNII